jgi:putative mRNA 3-end processing factor
MTLKASISERGAVLLGRSVACDSFDSTRPLRVVTHAHYDHLNGLRQSLRNCEAVVMTPATRDLLEVLYGSMSLENGVVKTLDYAETLTIEDEALSLHRADHILGAAQVLVEDEEGTRCVYTGDFRLSRTPIIEADVLVIESTYGNPFQVRPFEKIVESTLISLVESGLKHGPVYVFGYHGKLQELMQILHQNKVKAPFIVPEKVFKASKICEHHGMRLGKYLIASEEEAKTLIEKKDSYVAFHHMNSRRYVGRDAFRICVSGWEFNSPKRQIADNEHVIALSDHADFNGLLSYVKESNPKLVITDDYRVGDAKILAREITKRLGIKAMAMPELRQAQSIEARPSNVASQKSCEPDKNASRKLVQKTGKTKKKSFRVKNIDFYC